MTEATSNVENIVFIVKLEHESANSFSLNCIINNEATRNAEMASVSKASLSALEMDNKIQQNALCPVVDASLEELGAITFTAQQFLADLR